MAPMNRRQVAIDRATCLTRGRQCGKPSVTSPVRQPSRDSFCAGRQELEPALPTPGLELLPITLTGT